MMTIIPFEWPAMFNAINLNLLLTIAAIVAGSTAAVGATGCGLFAVSRNEYHRAGRVAKAEGSAVPAAPSAPGEAATAELIL